MNFFHNPECSHMRAVSRFLLLAAALLLLWTLAWRLLHPSLGGSVHSTPPTPSPEVSPLDRSPEGPPRYLVGLA